MKNKFLLIVFFSAAFFVEQVSFAQIPNCESLVPTYNIDFTSITSDSTWVSPSVSRNGNCCGTVAPDRCIDFVIVTGSQTMAITASICTGQLPLGAIFYQVDCGPLYQMGYGSPGDTALITVPGIHYVTFCKPGNALNSYCLTAITDTSQIPTSISEIEFVPFENNLSLNLSSPSSFTLNIFSADGKKVSEKNYSLGAGQHRLALPTENLQQGIYFCRVAGEGMNKSIKFIIR